jgi:hypothetical protein
MTRGATGCRIDHADTFTAIQSLLGPTKCPQIAIVPSAKKQGALATGIGGSSTQQQLDQVRPMLRR